MPDAKKWTYEEAVVAVEAAIASAAKFYPAWNWILVHVDFPDSFEQQEVCLNGFLKHCLSKSRPLTTEIRKHALTHG